MNTLTTPVADPTPEQSAWVAPAWDQIVREHGDRVYRLAYRLSGNQHDAEDITQETFIRVFRSLDSFQPGSFEGWLHRITTNVFLDMARRRQRIRMEALPEETDRIAGREPSPEAAFDAANLDPDLQAALDDLLPEFRAALVLCDVEGLSYEEIGQTLGVKLGTVRSRIHRARNALRAGLENRRSLRLGFAGGPGVTGFAELFADHLGMDAVVAYVDGELSLTAFQRAAAHLQRCPMCAAEVADQAFARESLRGAATPRMPVSLLANLCSIPVALPAAASAQGVARDPLTSTAIRVHTVGRDVTRSRRFRFGAGALVAGIAVGALVSTTPADPDSVTTPPAQPTVNRQVGSGIMVTPVSIAPNR